MLKEIKARSAAMLMATPSLARVLHASFYSVHHYIGLAHSSTTELFIIYMEKLKFTHEGIKSGLNSRGTSYVSVQNPLYSRHLSKHVKVLYKKTNFT
jgi:hypothetical protein